QRRPFATPRIGARVRAKRKRSAETRIKVPVTESFLQCRERWLAGAMPRRNIFDLEGIFQGPHCLCDNLVRGDDEMKAASDQMNLGIDSRRGLDNPFNPRMRAANDQHHTLRCVDSKRQLLELLRAGSIGHQRYQCHPWSDFGGLVDQFEIGPLPCGADLHDFWWSAAIVAHLRRQRSVLSIEARRPRRAIDADSFFG